MNNQLAILQAVSNQLQSITVANGYLTDLGLMTVNYWQDLDFEYKANALEIRDLEEEIYHDNLAINYNLPVKISAIHVINGDDDPLIIGCNLLADMKKAFSNPSFGESLKGIHLRTLLSSSGKNIETKGKKAIKVCLLISIKYKESINA
jgi:hypothetical protein